MGLVLDRWALPLVGRPRGDGLPRELVRLRRLATVAPIAFLTVVAYLLRSPAHEQLHSYPGFIYVLLVLAAGVTVFSFAIFALVGSVEGRLVEQNRQLEAVLTVGRASSSSLRLADMLEAALDEILGITSADAAEVWLLEGGELVLERHRGPDADAFRERTRFRLGEGFPGSAAQSGRPVIVHDLAADPRVVRRRLTELGFRSLGAFPLVRGGETVGVLGVASREQSAFSGGVERRLLEGIGEQLAVAIENARLHSRVLDAAVLEERERLAHELHDGLAQTLGYVNTQALAIRKLVQTGRSDEAAAEVAEMETTARQVYRDVREAILGLHRSTGGLLESLRAYVTGFDRLAGIQARLDADASVESLSLPPSTEIQLVRVVQEALANIRKHAVARSARIGVAVDDDELRVEIEDDGRGFDIERPRRTGWPHFGLQTMRERAEAIGGRLELVSAPGEGTVVRVCVPLESRTEERDARPAR